MNDAFLALVRSMEAMFRRIRGKRPTKKQLAANRVAHASLAPAYRSLLELDALDEARRRSFLNGLPISSSHVEQSSGSESKNSQ